MSPAEHDALSTFGSTLADMQSLLRATVAVLDSAEVDGEHSRMMYAIIATSPAIDKAADVMEQIERDLLTLRRAA